MGFNFLFSSQKPKHTSTQTCKLNLPLHHNKVCDFYTVLAENNRKERDERRASKQKATGVEISFVCLFQLSARTHAHTHITTKRNHRIINVYS